MKNKSVKEKTFKEVADNFIAWTKQYTKFEDFVFTSGENKMPPTLLDDDIADWEHDNLVK